MSGFVGILNPDGAPLDSSLLRRITDSMAYCGPDRQEIWLDGDVGLGHALLAPSPDAAGDDRQPVSLDGRVWIAADARIDARDELVRRLGISPAATDAELILHSYAAWAERCVDHLIGDFAFALWDGPERRLLCARDQFGVVPLYYARAGGGIVVGNVLRSLRLHPAVSDALDDRAIGDTLLFGAIMDPTATAFADLRALPPAHVLTYEGGTVGLRRYWEPPEPEPRPGRPEEHVERFSAVFDAAVGDRLRSTRAGAHLTGGMDSTSLATTAHRVLSSRAEEFDLRAYTVVFDELIEEEEGRYAEQVAARLGIRLEQVAGDESVLIAGQSALEQIARSVASFTRTLLAGTGGDPLFATSPARPSAWRALRSGRLPRLGVRTALRRRLRGGGPEIPPLPDWIDPSFARRADLPDRWRGLLSEWDRAEDRLAILHPLWPAIFAWSHPGAHGLPIRVVFPFFDLRLLGCVWETPAPLRRDKRLLREAMRGRLPETVVQRPKALLYVPTGRVHDDDPFYLLAQRPESRRLGLDLLSGGAISDYVDVERARELIESPVPRRTLPRFENCFLLANWLRSELGPSALPTPTKEKSDAGDPAAA